MSGGAIERVLTRVWGRGRRAAEHTTHHREQLLELCMLVQHAPHVWGPSTDEPLRINPAGVDDFWRGAGPGAGRATQHDDSLYRYALEHLKPMARAMLLHAEAARVARAARATWRWIWNRHAE